METAVAFRSGFSICNRHAKASLGGSDFTRFGSQLRMSPSGIKVFWSSVFHVHRFLFLLVLVLFCWMQFLFLQYLPWHVPEMTQLRPSCSWLLLYFACYARMVWNRGKSAWLNCCLRQKPLILYVQWYSGWNICWEDSFFYPLHLHLLASTLSANGLVVEVNVRWPKCFKSIWSYWKIESTDIYWDHWLEDYTFLCSPLLIRHCKRTSELKGQW